MKALDIFLILGEFALRHLCAMLQYPLAEMEPGLYAILVFILSLILWSWILRLTFELVKKAFGFGYRGRQ